MAEENMSQEFQMKEIHEANYFIQEIKQCELIRSTKRFIRL